MSGLCFSQFFLFKCCYCFSLHRSSSIKRTIRYFMCFGLLGCTEYDFVMCYYLIPLISNRFIFSVWFCVTFHFLKRELYKWHLMSFYWCCGFCTFKDNIRYFHKAKSCRHYFIQLDSHVFHMPCFPQMRNFFSLAQQLVHLVVVLHFTPLHFTLLWFFHDLLVLAY